ncbi:hypothetical protein ACEQ8H_008991 [Pleosporales sp. CAS-2024a]
MGTRNGQMLRSEADIITRQSRPQRNSTWVPAKRDWRYVAGIIQHGDFEDDPNARSVWDTLDYDHQTGQDRRSRAVSLGSSRSDSEMHFMDVTDGVCTPQSTVSRFWTISARPADQIYKSMVVPTDKWAQLERLTQSIPAREGGVHVEYETTAFVVRLCFTQHNRALFKDIVERSNEAQTEPTIVNRHIAPTVPCPCTPTTARTAATIHTPHVLDSIESLYTFPLFKRAWVDETYAFNMQDERSKLLSGQHKSNELGASHHWYGSAVPVDAIFPPGIPISAKEISAFYPHHVRWKGVMLRLTHNDYRGPEIMGMQAHFRGPPDYHMSPVYMNNCQRDAVKTEIPGFKTSTLAGKPDRNLRTDHLVPGNYIQSMRKGYTLPSFEELVRGLRRLPSGLDARGLTQCLSWYLNVRDTFTPKLELNVLHTQSLIRALRQPLKPFGPQNLDRNALEEWHNTGTFETVEIEDRRLDQPPATAKTLGRTRSRLHLDLDEEDVSTDVVLQVRHILVFPFLALHGVVGEAFKLGIRNAQTRQTFDREDINKRVRETDWSAQAKGVDNGKTSHGGPQQDGSTPGTMSSEPGIEEAKGPSRISKRPLPIDTEKLSSHKKARVRPSRPHAPAAAGPRRLAPPPSQALRPAPPRDQSYLSRPWNSPAPSSAYDPQTRHDSSIHGRRNSLRPSSAYTYDGFHDHVYDWRGSQARRRDQDYEKACRPD